MTTRRNPDSTRGHLLQAAFDEIHRQGFRGASVDNILRRTGVTKGALYHHFPSKQALGYAVVDEVVRPMMESNWLALLEPDANPVDALRAVGQERLVEGEALTLGCPVNNLVQEMAGLDEGFRTRLGAILKNWRDSIAKALTRGQASGTVREDLDPVPTAAFLVAAYEGLVGVNKCAPHSDDTTDGIRGILRYIESLRPAEARQQRLASAASRSNS